MQRELAMSKKQEYRVPGLNPPISHYTDAVRFGDLVFLSGIAPVDEELNVVGDDATAQAEQLFTNMKRVLDTVGATFADILKVTVYLTDVNDRTAINPIRQKYFGDARPASTLVGVANLAVPGMKIEIEAVVGLTTNA